VYVPENIHFPLHSLLYKVFGFDPVSLLDIPGHSFLSKYLSLRKSRPSMGRV